MSKSKSAKMRKVTSLILSAALVATLVPAAPIAAVAEEAQDELDSVVADEQGQEQQDIEIDEASDNAAAIAEEEAVVEDEAAVEEEPFIEEEPIVEDEAVVDETPSDPEAVVAEVSAPTDDEASTAAFRNADVVDYSEGASDLSDDLGLAEDALSAQYDNLGGTLQDDGKWLYGYLHDSKSSDEYYSAATSKFTLKHRSRVKLVIEYQASNANNGKLVLRLKKVNKTGEAYNSTAYNLNLADTQKHEHTQTYITDSSTPSIPAGEYEFYVVYQNTNDWSGNVRIQVKLNIPNLFNDLPKTHWSANVVADAVDMGLMSGYNVNQFGTIDSITRGQVATILWNFAGKPSGGKNKFSDVSSGKYYYKAICWAASRGVVSGYGNGTFKPEKNVTREELATMLRNYAVKYKGASTAGSSTAPYASMSDRGSVSKYARASVGWCFYRKIMTGNNGKILPKSNATRAEAAKMFVTLAKLMGKKTSY